MMITNDRKNRPDRLCLQEEKYWRGFIGKDVFSKKQRLRTELVNLPMTHSRGQRVVRFFDPDGNLIEVGTPM